MRSPRMARLVRMLLFAVALSVVGISRARAANPEETVKSWGTAIVTVVGLGWFWKRTFKAADTYDVWFGTNRRERIANTFDNEFGADIHYGKCRVSIPKGHAFGSIGSSPIRRWFQRLVSRTDDRLELISLVPMTMEEFNEDIKLRLGKYDHDERSILIFIHGYNVKFRDAAIRAAQMGFDLNVPGVMAFYSWPSKADTGSYFADADSIAASEKYIYEFIQNISKMSGASKVNIIAHSMGNLGLIRALSRGFLENRLNGIRFGQIFLAAPDIDVRLFRQLASIYPLCSDRTTMYISAVDRALLASRLVHSNQRTGYSPPVTVVPGVDTIETTAIDLGLLGHGYYASAAAVLNDIAWLIRRDAPPAKRTGLVSEQGEDGRYWTMRARAR